MCKVGVRQSGRRHALFQRVSFTRNGRRTIPMATKETGLSEGGFVLGLGASRSIIAEIGVAAETVDSEEVFESLREM